MKKSIMCTVLATLFLSSASFANVTDVNLYTFKSGGGSAMDHLGEFGEVLTLSSAGFSFFQSNGTLTCGSHTYGDYLTINSSKRSYRVMDPGVAAICTRLMSEMWRTSDKYTFCLDDQKGSITAVFKGSGASKPCPTQVPATQLFLE